MRVIPYVVFFLISRTLLGGSWIKVVVVLL